jgi:repressor LexA
MFKQVWPSGCKTYAEKPEGVKYRGGFDMVDLTEKQDAILAFIESSTAENGFPPSFAEIARHFKFRSLKAVSDHVDAIWKKGFLEIQPNKKRNLVSLRQRRERGIPILGSIAAGSPIMAIECAEEFLTADRLGLATPAENVFALVVKGNSMINRGIRSGDIVIVKQQRIVGRNDVAAVRVGNDVTLKYVHQQADCIKLVPDNNAMKPIIVRPDEDIEIMGKVIKLVREQI